MARSHDEENPADYIYEVAYQAYESGGYMEIVDAVRPLIEAAADAADDCVRVPRGEFERFVGCLSDGHEYDLTDWARCMLNGEKYEPEED